MSPDAYLSVPDMTNPIHRRLITFAVPVVVRIPSGEIAVEWAEGVAEPAIRDGFDLTLDVVHGAGGTVTVAPPVTVWVPVATIAALQYQAPATLPKA